MRLLLIDDEIELTTALSHFLEQQGYEPSVAHSGERGWQLLEGNTYDLVIVDWIMPGMSGLELCRHLRSQGTYTPILFLTAKDTLDDRVEGLESGADDYLVKPFELRELLARIRALLRRREYREYIDHPASTVSFQDLMLDCQNQVAYRQERKIPLSDKEFQLLYYFLLHPEQLLTHEQLLKHLWPGETPASNALVAQIRLLRRKIDGEKEPPLIHTVYGKGYRLSTA